VPRGLPLLLAVRPVLLPVRAAWLDIPSLVAAAEETAATGAETARSHFAEVVTTHTGEERWDTCRLVRAAGMELCCGGIVGMVTICPVNWAR
jgi:hypothetical protein